jgi:hypothetical protein
MARIAYDERDAAAFAANRHVHDDGLTGRRDAVARHDLRRAAHTPLQLITDDEYAAGLARLRRAAEVEFGPVIDVLVGE